MNGFLVAKNGHPDWRTRFVMTITVERRQAIEVACRNYIQTIRQLETGEIGALLGDMVRKQWHEQLLELTGLTPFEFGGLPAWIEIDDEDKIILRLYNALLGQMQAKLT